MNELKLKEFNENFVVYLYYPEGKDNFGEIRMDLNKNEVTVVSRASDDTYGSYAHKASNAVKERVARKNLPMEFINAWV